jgi:hypothetical protein
MTLVIDPDRAVILAALGLENNPVMAWYNYIDNATISGFSPAADGAAENAKTGATWNFYSPSTSSGSAWLQMDFTSNVLPSFAALAGHNLGSTGAIVSLQYTLNNGATWNDSGAGSVVATNDDPIGFRLKGTIGATRWRFYITSFSGTLAVATVFLGEEFIFDRRFYGGFSPVLTPSEIELNVNRSIGGQLLEGHVRFQGSSLSATLDNLSAASCRSAEYLALQEGFNKGDPVYFAWRPTKYPQDFYYGWKSGSGLRPTNNGVRDLMRLQISMDVYDA